MEFKILVNKKLPQTIAVYPTITAFQLFGNYKCNAHYFRYDADIFYCGTSTVTFFHICLFLTSAVVETC